MGESIVKQIAGLHRLESAQLKERWRELYGTEPPAYNRAFLIKRLAYRLQELTHGGLSPATPAKMKDILRGAGPTEESVESSSIPLHPSNAGRCKIYLASCNLYLTLWKVYITLTVS